MGYKGREFLSTEFCVGCGHCCKRMPAPYTPSDIVRIFGGVKEAKSSGIVAIDWWEDEFPIYFMRPKTVETNRLHDPSWGGRCIHLKKHGCELPREKRPFFCKALEPKEDRNCELRNQRGKIIRRVNYVSARMFRLAGMQWDLTP